MQRYGYECEIIRLSQLIEQMGGEVPSTTSFDRDQGLIDKGNEKICWRIGMSNTIFSAGNPDYLAGLMPRFAGFRRIPAAKLFFPE